MTVSDLETIEVRPDEKVDLTRLEPWLRENLEGAEGPLSLRQFGGGHANLTYLLNFGEREFVLRRPPLGHIAPSSHDMSREHRILSRLWRQWDMAPRSYVLCTDHDILGADFHVLERRHGFVLRATNPEVTDGKPELCRRIGEMTADVLASFHMVDTDKAGLGDLGRPEGFVERQVGGWSKRWDAALDETSPDASTVMAWFQADIPAAQAATLVHNDYKLDNIMVAHDDPARAVCGAGLGHVHPWRPPARPGEPGDLLERGKRQRGLATRRLYADRQAGGFLHARSLLPVTRRKPASMSRGSAGMRPSAPSRSP